MSLKSTLIFFAGYFAGAFVAATIATRMQQKDEFYEVNDRPYLVIPGEVIG